MSVLRIGPGLSFWKFTSLRIETGSVVDIMHRNIIFFILFVKIITKIKIFSLASLITFVLRKFEKKWKYVVPGRAGPDK